METSHLTCEDCTLLKSEVAHLRSDMQLLLGKVGELITVNTTALTFLQHLFSGRDPTEWNDASRGAPSGDGLESSVDQTSETEHCMQQDAEDCAFVHGIQEEGEIGEEGQLLDQDAMANALNIAATVLLSNGMQRSSKSARKQRYTSTGPTNAAATSSAGSARQPKKKIRRASPPCEICGRIFRDNYDLKMHMLRHTGEKPFACSLCVPVVSFATASSLKRHQQDLHPEMAASSSTAAATPSQPRNKAKQPRPSSRQAAVASSEPTTKTFVCKECAAEFDVVAALEQHMVTHITLDDCDLCGEGFTSSDELVRHRMDAHALFD